MTNLSHAGFFFFLELFRREQTASAPGLFLDSSRTARANPTAVSSDRVAPYALPSAATSDAPLNGLRMVIQNRATLTNRVVIGFDGVHEVRRAGDPWGILG